MTAASLALAFSYNLWMYCLCRVVLGMGKGASLIIVPMYTGEVAHKRNRGRLVLFMSIMILGGMVYSYATGSCFSTKVFTLLCTLPILISLLSILTFVPESPYFLVTRNKPRKEVAACLRKLRRSIDVEVEVKQIESVAVGFSFVQHISVIPLVSIVVFAVAYSFGLGPVPFAYLSELFPQQAKNVGVPTCMAIATVSNAAIAVTFPYFMEYLGMQWCFWIFAVNCLYAAIFTKYKVPETKGRTLEEIQFMLE
nr:unnamed protein product [Callosobruchus analis]